MLMHDQKQDDSIKAFFQDLHEVYIKVSWWCRPRWHHSRLCLQARVVVHVSLYVECLVAGCSESVLQPWRPYRLAVVHQQDPGLGAAPGVACNGWMFTSAMRWLRLLSLLAWAQFTHGTQPTSRYSRYLLYTVNPGEGFNLARDVYLRVATLVQELNKEQQWTLVLPMFGNPHWRTREYESFDAFFQLDSLSKVTANCSFVLP